MNHVVYSDMSTNPSRIGLAIVVASAFAIRIGYCAATRTLGRTPQAGYREYVIAGQRLITQRSIVSPLTPDDARAETSALMPPGYVAYVAASYWLLGVESWRATLWLQVTNAAATGIAAGVAMLIAGRIGGRRAGWGTGLIVAVNPALIGFTSYIWETSLFTLGVALSVWLSQRLAHNRTGLREYFVFGLWLGAVALLNPALTIAYPLLVLFPALRTSGGRWRRLSACIAAAVLGWAIAITPWSVRNYVQTGELIYVRSGFMLELWLGACPEADAGSSAAFAAQFPLNNAEVRQRIAGIGEKAFIAECALKAKAAIASDPIRFATLVLIRVVNYWTGASLGRIDFGKGLASLAPERLALMVFLTTEVLVLLAAPFAYRRKVDGRKWIPAILLLFSVVFCITHAQVRYRAPLEPLIGALLGAQLFGRGSHVEALDRKEI